MGGTSVRSGTGWSKAIRTVRNVDASEIETDRLGFPDIGCSEADAPDRVVLRRPEADESWTDGSTRVPLLGCPPMVGVNRPHRPDPEHTDPRVTVGESAEPKLKLNSRPFTVGGGMSGPAVATRNRCRSPHRFDTPVVFPSPSCGVNHARRLPRLSDGRFRGRGRDRQQPITPRSLRRSRR